MLLAGCDAHGLSGFPGLSRTTASENPPTQQAQPKKAEPAKSEAASAPAPAPATAAATAPVTAVPAAPPQQPGFTTPQSVVQQTPGGAIRTADITYVPPGETVPPPGAALPSALPPPPGQMSTLPATAAATGAPQLPPTALAGLPPGGLPPLALKGGQRLRAALLVPLSGPSAPLGKALLNAAQLALFEMGGQGFSLMPIDSKGTPEGAAQAARQAVDHGAQIVLGPLFSAEVRAAAPVALAAGLNLIGFSSDRQAAQPGVYLLGFLPRPQVERVVQHATQQGITKFAALVPNNDYGRAMFEAFRQSLAQHGGTLLEQVFFDPAAKDYADVVKKLAHFESRKAALNHLRKQLEAKGEKQELKKLEKQDTLGDVDYQAVFLPDDGGRLRSIAALLPYYDIDTPKVKLLGTMQWDDPTLGSEPALNGAWYAGAPPDGRNSFDERYKQAYGSKPPRLASLGYDAAALVATLAQAGAISNQTLLNPQGFAGVDGLFRLLPDGTSERGLAVMEVLRGQTPKVVSQPPAAF